MGHECSDSSEGVFLIGLDKNMSGDFFSMGLENNSTSDDSENNINNDIDQNINYGKEHINDLQQKLEEEQKKLQDINHELVHVIAKKNQTKMKQLSLLNFSLALISFGYAVSFRDMADLIVKKINEANQITFYQKLVQEVAPAIIASVVHVAPVIIKGALSVYSYITSYIWGLIL